MTAHAFDPQQPGARRLAEGWLENRHRWKVRLVAGVVTDATGVHPIGSEVELPRPQARLLVEDGVAELISTRVASAREG